MKATIRRANGDVIEIEGSAVEVAEVIRASGGESPAPIRNTFPAAPYPTPAPCFPAYPYQPTSWPPNEGTWIGDAPRRFYPDITLGPVFKTATQQ